VKAAGTGQNPSLGLRVAPASDRIQLADVRRKLLLSDPLTWVRHADR